MKVVTFAVLVSSMCAFAAPDGGVSCVEVEQRLASTQRTLAACAESTRSVSALRDRCETELGDSKEKTAATQSRVDACVASKEQQCEETAAYANQLLRGAARTTNACIPTEAQVQLQTVLTAWASIGDGLALLDEYAAGVTDVVPRVTGTTLPEQHFARMMRGGLPVWNRRILIAAFKLTAPNTWRKIRSGGALGIDAFFDAREPLSDAFISEAHDEHPEPPGPAGPPLSAALKMTQSYLEFAGCDSRTPPKECVRARQLVEILDNTGPLIIRRRVEEIWATPCGTLNVRDWLRDFPASRKDKGQSSIAELSAAARGKLFLCYLADASSETSYRGWAGAHLPPPAALDARTLPLVDSFANFVRDGDAVDRCGRAAKALQHLSVTKCAIDQSEVLQIISRWGTAPQPPDSTPELELEVCQRVTSLLWSGATVTIADEFSHPPAPAEMVSGNGGENDSAMTKLRAACDERRGTGADFEQALLSLSTVARGVGETVTTSPWRLDPTFTKPQELIRLRTAERYEAWASHVVNQESACEALGLSTARCQACRETQAGTHYDCDVIQTLQERWSGHRRVTTAGAVSFGITTLVMIWLLRLREARRTFAIPMRTAREHLEGLELIVTRSIWRLLLPSRNDMLRVELPNTPAWERWGRNACAVLAPGTASLREADVNHAAAVALREDARVVFLLHADTAVPDLGAVRATLDWAARGGTRAVQVLPLAISRLAWATRDEDLLDLVEATTLRGNPFEVRGPVRSSSQFWNRERLVAGLLTESRAGNWVVVTGLRRFGKSSLALEVARRTTGPSAYVDLAGFHHEVLYGDTPALAVEAILKTLVVRLAESTILLYPAAVIPPVPTTPLDAPTLASWVHSLGLACGTSSGTPPPPMFLVLDEVEQLLTTTPDKLGRALEVLSTLIGRLRSAVADPTSPHIGGTVGVVMCAAVHPLLWAPLTTLGGQSLMGAFPSICVPALDDDAAHAMMRGLGGRQGIRFEDDALAALVRASHGVPLLLRRLGTSVLELYDADRARQGALGAVRVGIEGANEAIAREERGGSPLRVWVESEIAQSDTSAGVLLRALAVADKVPATVLRQLGEAQVMERFMATGLTAHLSPVELKRRAQEAASVMVRLLAETKLLQAHGDMTSPDAYSLPDGVLRRILSKVAKS